MFYLLKAGVWTVEMRWTACMPLLNKAFLVLLLYNLYDTQLVLFCLCEHEKNMFEQLLEPDMEQ
jgi:hypothetical protein